MSEDEKTRITRLEERVATVQSDVRIILKTMFWVAAGIGGSILTEVMKRILEG